LTTAGNLLFGGNGEYLMALDPATGKTLWHSKTGGSGPPETYMLDGKQYLLSASSGRLYAFVLNSNTAASPAVISSR
jgi:alcohol dehydrogenase (cytochrome c)